MLTQRGAIDELHDNVEAVVLFEGLEVAHYVGMLEVVAYDGHLVDYFAQTRVVRLERVQVVCVDLFHGEEDGRVLFFDFVDAAERARAYDFVDGIVVYVVGGRLCLIADFDLLLQAFHVFFLCIFTRKNKTRFD